MILAKDKLIIQGNIGESRLAQRNAMISGVPVDETIDATSQREIALYVYIVHSEG
ncbi:hypothetical protein FACS189443_3170 [Planctomycetales bacterium]|nr:hypothetical protein FACS189443_3170 [Planctomycetales bacterium]